MTIINDISKYNDRLISNKEKYTMIVNHVTSTCNRYYNTNLKTPNIYISDDIKSLEYFTGQEGWVFNSQFYIYELIGTLNGFNVYVDEFMEIDKFCVCDEREFNILKRRNKIDNILKRINK